MSLLLLYQNNLTTTPAPEPIVPGGGGGSGLGGNYTHPRSSNVEIKELENRRKKLKVEDEEIEAIIKMWMQIKNN